MKPTPIYANDVNYIDKSYRNEVCNMFPFKNSPPVPPAPRQFDPFSIRPSRAMQPVPKPKASIPTSIASFLNPNDANGGLTKTLSNVQQVMNMVESAGPTIKEYGPMVKNIPAMIKMMKALNEPDEKEIKTESDIPNKSKKQLSQSNEESVKETVKENRSRTSKPKLFI